MTNGISGLLERYSAGLKEARARGIEPVLRERRPMLPTPTTPQFFTAEDVASLGLKLESGEDFSIEAGWLLKLTPPTNGAESAFSLVSPEGWELLEDRTWLSPEGESYTFEQLEQMQAEQPEIPLPMLYGVAELKRWAGVEISPEEYTQIIAELAAFDEEDWERLYNRLIEEGRTEENEAFLRQLGATDEEIDNLFAELPSVITPASMTPKTREERGFLLTTNFPGLTEEQIESFFALSEWGVHRGEQGIVFGYQELEDSVKQWAWDNLVTEEWRAGRKWTELTPDLVQHIFMKNNVGIDTLVKIQTGVFPPPSYVEQLARSFVIGWGDMLGSISGAASWLGFGDSEDVQRIIDAKAVADINFLSAMPLSVREPVDWAEWTDVDHWATWFTKVTRAAPYALSAVPAGIAAFYGGTAVAGLLGFGKLLTWIIGGLAAGAVNRPIESLMEAGGFYNERIAAGDTPEEASEATQEVFINNMKLASFDAFEIAIMLAPTPGWIPKRLVQLGLVRTMTVGGKVIIVGLSEGGEEIFQDAFQRWASGEKWEWDPISQEVFSLGMAMGAFMGLGGDIITSFTERTYDSLSPELQKKIDDRTAELREQGVPESSAKFEAIGDLMATEPEISEAARQVISEEQATQEKTVSQINDYLSTLNYNEAGVAARIAEIQELLAVKGKLPTGMGTRAEVELELARLQAMENLASMKVIESLDGVIKDIQTEEGNRSLPYHGGARNLFPDHTTAQLEEMLGVYEGAREATKAVIPEVTPEETRAILETKVPLTNQEIEDFTGRMEMFEGKVYRASDFTTDELQIMTQARIRAEAAKPKAQLTAPEQTADEVRENALIPGSPVLTPAQAEKLLDLFGKYVMSPSTETAWNLTQELRRKTRSQRFAALKARTQELIIEKGMKAEEAVNQAKQEVMAGAYPEATTDFLSDLTEEMRDALFAKVYHVLKNEPAELLSTTQALTNALLGKAIPREPGVRGGSAYTRLRRVFGTQPEAFEALQRTASEGKALDDIIEGVFHETDRPPIPVDQEMADYLRNLKTDEVIARQFPLEPRPTSDTVKRVLKEIGWSPVDIGNFIRANRASCDFSFWRQQAPLILNHPASFFWANLEAWKAIWSQKSAEASMTRIERSIPYQEYERCAEEGADFLRPLTLKRGEAQWRGVEEFGYLTGERLIPRVTQKIPWINISNRIFVTGANEHNWAIFCNHYNAMLNHQERIAAGKIKLKPGEAFDMHKEMLAMAKLLADMSGRGSLGKAAPLAPTVAALVFAPRYVLGRVLSPRHLVSSNPHVRMEAWRDLVTFVGTISAIVYVGFKMGLWDYEDDPRSAEYMSIRIGDTRIDPWGGYRQYVVFFARVLTGTGVSSVTGAEYEVDFWSALTHFARGKSSPLASILAEFWTGKNFVGEEVDVKNPEQWVERLAPFAIWDIYEAWASDPDLSWKVALPSLLGAGTQTYTGDWGENFLKLGLPKYSDNLDYGVSEPVYDTADFWSDTASQFKDVDPETLTEAKGFPAYIPAIAEAYNTLRHQLQILPSEKLININADPEQGTTFGQYYQMWLDREKIVASGDEEALKAFDTDERTRNAHMGNFSQREYALLVEYHSLMSDRERSDFREEHPEITLNPRTEWLKAHPEENAQLALWGQSKVYSLEAYNRMKELAVEFDIPDGALPSLTLPPENQVENYFKYLELGDELGYNSAKVKLLLAQNDELRQWLGRDPITTPIEALEISVKYQEQDAWYDEGIKAKYTDEDSPEYIGGVGDRQDAIEEEKKQYLIDNPEYADDRRRRDAYGFELPLSLIEDYVEWFKTERKGYIDDWYLLEHKDFYDTMVDLKKMGERDFSEVPDVKWRALWEDWIALDEQYDGYSDRDSEFYIPPEGTAREDARAQLLANNPQYRKDRRKRQGIEYGLPETVLDAYVDFFEIPPKSADPWYNIHPDEPYYEDDWYLMEHPEFEQAMVDLYKATDGQYGWKEKRNFAKVPTREVYALYRQYLLEKKGQARLDFRAKHPDLDAWLVLAKGLTPIEDRGREEEGELSPEEEHWEDIERARRERWWEQ